MKLADLAFIVLVLFVLSSVVRLGYLLLRARSEAARRAGRRLTIVVAGYVVILLAVALVSPGEVRAMHTPWCFDDWCVAVDSVVTAPDIQGARPKHEWRVAWLTVSSTMRRARQAEPDAYVFLLDAAGNRHEASAAGERALDALSPGRHRLTDMLEPSSAISVAVAFDVSPSEGPYALSKSRRNRFPGMFIVGDAESLLHRPTTVPLP